MPRKLFFLSSASSSVLYVRTLYPGVSQYLFISEYSILSIRTTKHNLNFDTFYLIKCPYRPPPNPNTIGKLRLSAFQRYGSPPPSAHFRLFWREKNIKCSLPAANQQNTSCVNLFSFTNKVMTPMRMSTMVAIPPIWLLW
jgi:hypothetical protein